VPSDRSSSSSDSGLVDQSNRETAQVQKAYNAAETLEGSRPSRFHCPPLLFCRFFLTQSQRVSSIDIVESTEIVEHIITQIFIISGFAAKVSVLLLYCELICVERSSEFGTLPFFQPIVPGVCEWCENGRFEMVVDG
jgi:hypothetical protein